MFSTTCLRLKTRYSVQFTDRAGFPSERCFRTSGFASAFYPIRDLALLLIGIEAGSTYQMEVGYGERECDTSGQVRGRDSSRYEHG